MDQQYDKILRTKSPEWRYEREWRLITNSAGNHEFPRETLVAVIFGLHTADEQKERVRGWLRDAPVSGGFGAEGWAAPHPP